MATKENNFNDQLHEDLFDLFILNFLFRGLDKVIREDVLEHSRCNKLHDVFRDLFPQENEPEKYERYVGDESLKNIHKADYWGRVYVNASRHRHCQNKITITVEQE